MIKSTVSGGALVTSSPSDAKSTRQRGVKHSITKRFTQGARREVRLVSLGPRKTPSKSRRIVEPQVAQVLVRQSLNASVMTRSWPKTIDPAVDRRKSRPAVRRCASVCSIGAADSPSDLLTGQEPAPASAGADHPWSPAVLRS